LQLVEETGATAPEWLKEASEGKLKGFQQHMIPVAGGFSGLTGAFAVPGGAVTATDALNVLGAGFGGFMRPFNPEPSNLHDFGYFSASATTSFPLSIITPS
jgi:hypothetical protein